MSKFLDDNGLLYLVQKIKTWLGEKADSSHSHTISEITDYSEYELPTASSSTLGGIKVGENLTIASDGTLNAEGTSYDEATTTSSGLMSATDKAKLDTIEESANNYTLPTASSTVLGGVKVGTNLSISNGVLNATDTTYTNVSELTNDSGYQTASDVSTAITNALSGITGISYSVVTALPTTGEAGVIYLLANAQTETSNIYDEYIYVNSAFEKIGTTAVDLSGYLTTDDVQAITNSEIDAICA